MIGRNKSCHANPIGFSPILFYGDDDGEEFNSKKANQDRKKSSFFNMDFGNDIPRADISEMEIPKMGGTI